MDTSIFTDKSKVPSNFDLTAVLGEFYCIWQEIVDYVYQKHPQIKEEWKYPGIKYGWSFRLKDSKRVIVYLLPRKYFFKVAFMFGQNATDAILQSSVSSAIKTELESAKVYAEGRGIRIDVVDKTILSDLKTLIDIKLEN